jgi:hypothetical protein
MWGCEPDIQSEWAAKQTEGNSNLFSGTQQKNANQSRTTRLRLPNLNRLNRRGRVRSIQNPRFEIVKAAGEVDRQGASA